VVEIMSVLMSMESKCGENGAARAQIGGHEGTANEVTWLCVAEHSTPALGQSLNHVAFCGAGERGSWEMRHEN
jgi:hypothetical protein